MGEPIVYQTISFDSIPWKQTDWLGPGDPSGEFHHLLHEEPRTGALSLLIRFAPGYIGKSLEWHSVAQELFLIDGDLTHTGRKLQAPAFIYVPAGAVHGNISSEGGALLFVKVEGPLDINYVED